MNPRNNVRRKRKANKRMRAYRLVHALIYRWEDLVKVPVEPDIPYEEEGFGPTITVGYDSLTNHRFREAIGGIPFEWN